MSAPRRPVLLGGLTVAAAFLVGVGTGALLFRTAPEQVEETVRMTAPPALFEGLALTDEQQERIDSILAAMRRSTDSVMDDTRVDMVDRATRARRAIEEVLTPEQVESLEERFETLGPLMIRRVRVNDTLLRVDTIR